jgi:SagB-type dehydrogenase family enzyme
MTQTVNGSAEPGSTVTDRPKFDIHEPLFTVDPLVMEVSGEKIVVSSPRITRRLRVDPSVAALLLAARDGLQPTTVAQNPGSGTAIAKLVSYGFLVSSEDRDTTVEAPWGDWGLTAWSFHTRNRDTRFVGSPGHDEQMIAPYREKILSRPRPSSVRAARSDRILLLPRVRTPLDVPFRSVLENRRTHRHFADEPIDLDRFSDMLHYCFAPLRFVDAGQMGTLQLRASASGGARHETEAFVFVLDVAGVEPGIYHYDNIRHGLEPIRIGDHRATLDHLTYEQDFVNHACFAVLTVAVADRMSWKYPHPRAYKLLLQNVGHVAQVFSMTACALGLGAAITGAIRDSEADKLLELDQPREFTTFALACGVPILSPEGLPAAIKAPSVATDFY